MKLYEVNPNTFQGSLGPGLVDSKFWLLTELQKIKNKFDTIYILGSWYGAMGAMLAMDPRIDFKKIITVETSKKYLEVGKRFIKMAGGHDIEPMLKDANELDYRQLDVDSLIINTSCGNIYGNDWFENIPKGTLVVLQGRNRDPDAVNQFSSLKEFVNTYTPGNILFARSKKFKDPETVFESYLVIGTR